MSNQKDFDIHPLFSTPILKVNKKFNMTKELRHYIENLPMDNNDYNLISKNRYILTTDNNLSSLKKYVLDWLEFYAYNIHHINNVKFYITQSWFNITRKNEYHHIHKHKNSIISGVFHLDDDMSNLEFYTNQNMFELALNIKDWNIYNARSFKCKTEANTLFLFPSNLDHKVDTNKSDKNRISLSFNTYVKGFVGDKVNCSYLDI